MTDETTTEQLVGIERQAESTPATEYTPTEHWRVLQVGEPLMGGDEYHEGLNRYIRRTESQPQPEPQPVPVQVREGRWRTRGGQEIPVTAMPTDHDDFTEAYPWWDGNVTTWANNGRFSVHENAMDLDEYLGPIAPQPEPEAEPESDADERIQLLKQANDSQAETIGRLLSEARDLNMEIGGLERQLSERHARIRDVETMHAAAAQAVVDAGKGNDKLRAQVDELRSEVSYVQRLLGESQRRVTQLEDLVTSLRTINEAQEKAVEAAGQHNSDLQSRLNGVCSEWVQQTETIRKLQIELDAAQQVPADSPELRQLRLDLAEVTQDRDTYRHAHELLLNDVNATHQRTKVMTIEAIVEWLVPIRTCGSQALATAVISNLPHIMRSLAGLEDEGIE